MRRDTLTETRCSTLRLSQRSYQACNFISLFAVFGSADSHCWPGARFNLIGNVIRSSRKVRGYYSTLLDFLFQASHTSKKYLPETTGSSALRLRQRRASGYFPGQRRRLFLAMRPRFRGPSEGNHSAGLVRVGCISALPGDAETHGRPENAAIHYQLARFYKQMHWMDKAKIEFQRTEELQSRAARLRPSVSPNP